MTPLQKAIEEKVRTMREQLADIEHQRWSDWQIYCHKVLRENCPSPELEKVLERWDKQIATSYKDLSEKEKDSDREQVDRYLPVLNQALLSIAKEAVGSIELEGKLGLNAHTQAKKNKCTLETGQMFAERGWGYNEAIHDLDQTKKKVIADLKKPQG